MSKKMGANRVDQNRIAELAKSGKSAEEISGVLLIDEKVVKAFMPKATAEKATAEKADDKK